MTILSRFGWVCKILWRAIFFTSPSTTLSCTSPSTGYSCTSPSTGFSCTSPSTGLSYIKFSAIKVLNNSLDLTEIYSHLPVQIFFWAYCILITRTLKYNYDNYFILILSTRWMIAPFVFNKKNQDNLRMPCGILGKLVLEMPNICRIARSIIARVLRSGFCMRVYTVR